MGKQTREIEYFVSGATAQTTTALVGVNNNTAAYYVHQLREIIAQAIQTEMPLAGEVEVDESYFGDRRKGTRGRGAAGKVPVFGFLSGGAVFIRK